MGKLERVFRRTASGAQALESKDPALSAEHLQVLALIEGEVHWDEIKKLLRRHADFQRLAELESRGLVVSEAEAAGADLDFTGNFAFGKLN